MRFGSIAKVLLKRKLKYYRISECTVGLHCKPCSVDPIRLADMSAILQIILNSPTSLLMQTSQ